MDRRGRVPETHRGDVEPEIIPPDVRGRDPYSRTSFDGARRIYVARIGPVGFALMAATIAALTALFFILLLGAFIVLLPLAGLALAIIVAVGLLRMFVWRR